MRLSTNIIYLLLIGGLARAEETLPAGLHVVFGPVNGVCIQRDGRTLAVYGDPFGKQSAADLLLLTHARRDVTWAARSLAERGVKVVAPEQEAEFLTHPERFWAELREKRFHDYDQLSTKVPVEPIPVSRSVKAGDLIVWADLSIRVLGTPGYTRGAVSYLVELEGKKVGFTGDLIRDDGKLQDLFSLQDAIPGAKVGGYHGWAGRLGELVASLDRVAAEKPDLLVPIRGPVIRDPQAAINRLQQRIRAVYSNYLSIDALRWYFKDDHIRAKARRVMGPEARVDWMPMAETLKLPGAIIPISNSRLLLAADGSGFLVDCGGIGIVEALRKLRAAGKLASVEHVFVTHYHDDHTDALPTLVAEFGAKVHACGSLVDLIERPGDYRLPCLTKNPTAVTAKHRDHDTWRWKEYQLTIFDYPGQTLHHNGLLARRDGDWSAFFVGDSFTPSGIDDYCLQNRNFLHEGQGFFRCLDQLEQLPAGCLLLNQHVEPAFRFSSAQISQMRDTLQRRISLLADLLPFDDPNYGLDEGWAVMHPYWTTVRPGESAKLALRITNHSPRAQSFRAALHTPQDCRCSRIEPVRIAAHAEGLLEMTLQIARSSRAGLRVVTADVSWDGAELREWAEAVVEVMPAPVGLNQAAKQYLGLIENFAGFAEAHWNETAGSYDAKGTGVTWARGNGGVTLVNAVLLTELPEQATFSPKRIPRGVLLEHTRRALRTLALTSRVCTDPRATRPGTWGGLDVKRGAWHWQAGLETEHWVVAARLLRSQLDDDTKTLLRQVATAEADAAMREIPSARKGDTAADDCCWNAGVLGVCAAIYADDPRAARWDEWAKRWALNTESRETDRDSRRFIDGKPLGEWLVSTNVFPDLTLENHGFWDLPYQTCFAALAEPIVAHRLCGRSIPEAFHAHALEEGDQILKWLVLPDGDLLCPQGIDWAERDVQHSWAFSELGTLLDQPWARAADARCLKLLTRRQAVFGDGSIHALDFGYETDLAVVWTYSFLLHKFWGKGDAVPDFVEPRGSKVFPYVATAVHRAPDLVSSVTWFRSRQAVMVSPNHLETMASRPAFTRYDETSGTGWIRLKGDSKGRPLHVEGEPQITRVGTGGDVLTVVFSRAVKNKVRQQIGYCALPQGAVAVFSRWEALGDLKVAELVDHSFRWVQIEKFISPPEARQTSPGVWVVDDKLRMDILGGAGGEVVRDGINGAARRGFSAKTGEVLQDSVCIYQALIPGRPPLAVAGNAAAVQVGDWQIRRDVKGGLVAQEKPK